MRLTVVLLAFVLALTAVCRAETSSKGCNIRGYESGSIRWLLGMDLSDVDLSKFSGPTLYDDLPVYESLNQRLKFAGRDMDCLVYLMAEEGELVGLSIVIGYEQMSKAKVRKYYRDRLEDCSLVESSDDLLQWEDAGGDALSLSPFYANGSAVGTIVTYARKSQHAADGQGMPDWLKRVYEQ